MLVSGCSSIGTTAVKYSVEGLGYISADRYKRSDDVVLVKGFPGKPNRLYVRRGMNPLWGPSELLGDSGIGWWDYVEKNRRVQIYSSVSVAMFGKYEFLLSPDAYKCWVKEREHMNAKYASEVDLGMYQHLLQTQAQFEESTSELKQEKRMFKIRQKPYIEADIKKGSHDELSFGELVGIGFIHKKEIGGE